MIEFMMLILFLLGIRVKLLIIKHLEILSSEQRQRSGGWEVGTGV